MNAHVNWTIRGMLLLGCFLALVLLSVYGVYGVSGFSGSVTVAFDPIEDPDIIGYRVYYGLVSREYTHSVDIGSQNIYTLTGLTPGRTYYVAVTSYDVNDNESVYSQEISYNVGFVPWGGTGSDMEASNDKSSGGCFYDILTPDE